ncbi:T9SS type A sorting domain-containing protein [Winogradskyella wichelsiae]|uniref:T9SS type A sorting domain-containing protein n=1 Tax=Winogradskyella wichelsiae TaxID=2697007 RepID=UPI0015CA9DF2|nr:T9SS type A sorting domain-containing protein [Winogradskyella wichelsiae]
MNKLYFFIILFSTSFGFAQIVNIPDANFKNALLNTNCVDTNNDGNFDSDADTNDDGEIQVSEAENVTSLFISLQNISSVVGLSNFVNLTELYCSDNPLLEFDVSALTNLERLRCVDLDLVEVLDFSSNSGLTSLECDLNDSLESLNIQNGNNVNLTRMWANSSPNLECIQVDDENFANGQACNGGAIQWCKDNSAVYSVDCASLSISDFNLNLTKVHPNPTKDIIKVSTNLSFDSFEIYNISGQLLIKEKLKSGNINLTELKSGVYFLKLSSQEKGVTKKIIKE